MKNISKMLCVVLALIMMVSVCVLPTSAAGDMSADVKFTMTKNTEQSTDTYDVYTVTASVKAGANGIAILEFPIVYDATVLKPSSMNASGVIKYTTAMKNPYKYPAYAKLGELAKGIDEKYFFSADGKVKDYEFAEESTVAPACGATISATVAEASNLGSLDTSKYAAIWYSFESIVDSQRYLVANGEYVDFAEFYFFTAAGTDVTGAVVGQIGDSRGASVVFDTTGKTYCDVATAQTADGTATMTNAVGPAPSIVNAKRQQIRFNEDGSAFDYRFVAEISAADFESYFSSDIPTACSKIKDIGFVFASTDNVADFNMATAKALVEKGTAASGYLKKECKYISQSFSTNTDGEEVTEDVEGFVFSCVVTGITNSEANAYALAYMAFDSNGDGVNEYVYYPVATYATFSTLYDYYYPVAILGL